MKFINKICGISLIAFLIMLAAPNMSKAQEGGYVSYQEFYDELDPYGTWVNDPQYGNVWIPDAGDDFRPYATRGHWVVTDYGNTWVSDMNGAGPRFIMAAGVMMIITAGNGFRATNGHLHGLAGGMAAVTMAGRLYNRASVSAYHWATVTVCRIITGFVRHRLILPGQTFTTIMYRQHVW